MGVLDSTEALPEKLLELYGTDPVHLMQAGYNAIDGRLADKFVSMEE